MGKYDGVNYWRGIWGSDKSIVDNKVWKPWTPMVVRIREGTLKAKFIVNSELEIPEETISEIKCVNVNNINDTMWMTDNEFKEGMHTKMQFDEKIAEMQSTINTLKEMVKM